MLLFTQCIVREATGSQMGSLERAASLSYLDKNAMMCYYKIVMNRIKQTIDTMLYSYNPREFMPIYMDGKLANRNQFILYKVKNIVTR